MSFPGSCSHRNVVLCTLLPGLLHDSLNVASIPYSSLIPSVIHLQIRHHIIEAHGKVRLYQCEHDNTITVINSMPLKHEC